MNVLCVDHLALNDLVVTRVVDAVTVGGNADRTVEKWGQVGWGGGRVSEKTESEVCTQVAIPAHTQKAQSIECKMHTCMQI